MVKIKYKRQGGRHQQIPVLGCHSEIQQKHNQYQNRRYGKYFQGQCVGMGHYHKPSQYHNQVHRKNGAQKRHHQDNGRVLQTAHKSHVLINHKEGRQRQQELQKRHDVNIVLCVKKLYFFSDFQ